MADRIQVRRDSKSNWEDNNPILALGEIGFEIDTNKIKIGNGINNWVTLPYIFATENNNILEKIQGLEQTIQSLEERITKLETPGV